MWDFFLGFVVASVLWGVGIMSTPKVKQWYLDLKAWIRSSVSS